MLCVRLIADSTDLAAYVEHTPTHCSLLAFLQSEFPTWPETARLYKEAVSVENDVTPQTDAEAEALDETTQGIFYVVVWPGDPVTAIITIVATLAITAAILLLTPAVVEAGNNKPESSNNALSNRTNKPRPNGRIPDIFGRVRSVPDLIAVPYKIFKDHREVEVAYFCVGRGAYEISDICDDNTPVSEIEGMSVEVYGPNTSPLSGVPQLTVGDPITDELLDVRRSTAVNGQVLYPANFKKLIATDNVRAEGGNKFKIRDTAVFVWPQFYEPGDQVEVTNGIVGGKNLNGIYTVAAVDNDFLTLSSPAAVAPDWATVGTSAWFGPTIQISPAPAEAGPFYVQLRSGGKLLANVVALSGLYKQATDKQLKEDVEVELTLTPVNEAGVPTGAPAQVFTGTLNGSSTTKGVRAATLTAAPTGSGRFAVTARRLTDTDYDFDGTVVDEIKLRDFYEANPVSAAAFGDVTTVFAVTYGTEGATAIKERKLNLDATRKVLVRNLDDTFGPTLAASRKAADIICHMALDPFIGGRTLSELDVPQIYATADEVLDYFGLPASAEFGYTFDQENISFEEMVQSVAVAMFCTAYRQGSKLRLFFERETTDSTLLLNHRNKLPGSERRTIRFGNLNDHDGVELDYMSAVDGAKLTAFAPADRSAVKPKKMEIIGVQSDRHAKIHIQRIWNKMRWQHTVTSFSALAEASQLVLNERIEVTDNTRPDVFDGHILQQDGMTLSLSQPFTPTDGVTYVIYIQNPDGGMDVIDILPGSSTQEVVLQSAPSFTINTDPDIAADTVYQIVGSDAARTSAFLLTEKGAYDKRSIDVQAINYDDRYYHSDTLYRPGFLRFDVPENSGYVALLEDI
jgi:hypothetical protein